MSVKSFLSKLPLSLLLKAMVAVGLLYLIFVRFADFGETFRILREIKPGYAAAAVVLALVGELLTAKKWSLLIRAGGGRISLGKAYKISLIGMFYNNFLPGSVGGDLARVVLAAKEAGGKAKAAASSFMQRSTGFGGLLIVALIMSSLFPVTIEAWSRVYEPAGNLFHWYLMVAVLYVIANVILFNSAVYRMIWRWRTKESSHPLPGFFAGYFRKGVRVLQRFHEELKYFRPWTPVPLGLSVITQITDTTMVFLLSRALGFEASYTLFLACVPMITLAMLIPISLNGIGVREAMYLVLLGTAGIGGESAVALSMAQFGVILILSSIGATLQIAGRKP